LGLSFVLLTCLGSSDVTAQSVERWVTISAGPEFSNASIQVSSTIGEPMTTTMTSSTIQFTQGMQQPNLLITAVDAPEMGISVYPSPTFDFFVVSSEIQLKGTYRITSLGGESVLHGELDGANTHVFIGHLSSGTYVLTTTPDSGKPNSYRLSKL
jgi:hypothetical protein